MKFLISGALTCLLVTASAVAQQGDHGRLEPGAKSATQPPGSRLGWHFYDDPLGDSSVTSMAPSPAAPSGRADQSSRPELERFRQLQREVEEVRAVAIIRPTEANVRRYMELESRVVRNASRFADLAQRIAWTNPELDPATQGRPVNASALEAYEQNQVRERADMLAAIGRNHVLIFFFRGDCGYCHKLAPVLDSFRARHGIPVVAVSVDGGAIAGFPGATTDNGIARALKVSQVPALYLAQPFTGRIVPVGFGVLSESQLMERIITLTDRRDSAPQTATTFWPDN